MQNRQAIQKYSATAIQAGDPFKTVIMLYDTLIRLLYKAKKSIDENDIVKRNDYMKEAAAVVDLLHNGLDLSNESKLIKLLDKFYTNLFIKLNMVVIKNQGNDEIDSMLQSIRGLRVKWQEFDSRNEELQGQNNGEQSGGIVMEQPIETDVKC